MTKMSLIRKDQESMPTPSEVNNITTLHAARDKKSGSTQYPNTQRDWKKEMDPPRSCVLAVTTIDPTDTRTKTVTNSLPSSCEESLDPLLGNNLNRSQRHMRN